MSNYPSYDYGLITLYLHDIVGKRIIDIQRRVQKFILDNGPILEGCYQNLLLIDSKPFGNITAELVEQNLRFDLAGAERSLHDYNTVFDEVSTKLIEATSHENIQQFLMDNRISLDQIALFRSELSLNWEVTFGRQIERIAELKELLKQIRDILQEEVQIMRSLVASNPFSFIQAVAQNRKSRELFFNERQLFYKIIEVSEVSEGEVTQLESKIKLQLKIVTIKMITYKNSLNQVEKMQLELLTLTLLILDRI